MKHLNYLSILILSVLCIACGPTSGDETAIDADAVFEAENFKESFGSVEKNASGIKSSGDSWVTFDLNVPAVGRYKTEVLTKGSGSVWVEDYHDNPCLLYTSLPVRWQVELGILRQEELK